MNPGIVSMKLNPRNLFLIDGFGAILSAFLLGVVLTKFESTFGMPSKVLYFLCVLPCLFAIYDFSSYLRVTRNLSSFLKAIAIANLVYCSITVCLLISHFPKLTTLGFIYFFLELVIVVILAGIELRTAASIELES